MLKLAALGALGYAGYKYYQKNMNQSGGTGTSPTRNKVAGGPLSDEATVQPTASPPTVQ